MKMGEILFIIVIKYIINRNIYKKKFIDLQEIIKFYKKIFKDLNKVEYNILWFEMI